MGKSGGTFPPIGSPSERPRPQMLSMKKKKKKITQTRRTDADLGCECITAKVTLEKRGGGKRKVESPAHEEEVGPKTVEPTSGSRPIWVTQATPDGVPILVEVRVSNPGNHTKKLGGQGDFAINNLKGGRGM